MAMREAGILVPSLHWGGKTQICRNLYINETWGLGVQASSSRSLFNKDEE